MKCCICGADCGEQKYMLKTRNNELPICRECNNDLEYLQDEYYCVGAYESLREKLRDNLSAEVNDAVESRYGMPKA